MKHKHKNGFDWNAIRNVFKMRIAEQSYGNDFFPEIFAFRKALSPTEIALDTELSSVGKTTPASSYSRLQSTL